MEAIAKKDQGLLNQSFLHKQNETIKKLINNKCLGSPNQSFLDSSLLPGSEHPFQLIMCIKEDLRCHILFNSKYDSQLLLGVDC